MREWITGRNPIYETLVAKRRQYFELRVAEGAEVKGKLEKILELARKSHLPVNRVQRQQLTSISENHQGIALQTSPYPYSDLATILMRAKASEQPGFFLLLDSLQDPQNLGTLLRTAEAVGVNGVFIPSHRAAGVTPAVVNASSGASEHLHIAAGNLAQIIKSLKENGAWIIGLEGSAAGQLIEDVDLSGSLALVVGGEGSGLRNLVRKSCDLLLRLPMQGKVESLNAAVAGSITLYTAFQARRK